MKDRFIFFQSQLEAATEQLSGKLELKPLELAAANAEGAVVTLTQQAAAMRVELLEYCSFERAALDAAAADWAAERAGLEEAHRAAENAKIAAEEASIETFGRQMAEDPTLAAAQVAGTAARWRAMLGAAAAEPGRADSLERAADGTRLCSNRDWLYRRFRLGARPGRGTAAAADGRGFEYASVMVLKAAADELQAAAVRLRAQLNAAADSEAPLWVAALADEEFRWRAVCRAHLLLAAAMATGIRAQADDPADDDDDDDDDAA